MRHLIFALVLSACSDPRTVPPTPLAEDYDPIALARASVGRVDNWEAGVPAMCYTATERTSNPCWVCHTSATSGNPRNDVDLQREYAFSDTALTNHWTNLFVDRTRDAARWDDAAMLSYIREDNVVPLRRALESARDYPGYVVDLAFERGFDEDGFARDGSGWRALRYKPFPGTFWPTNGSSDDVFIRLPRAFRSTADGAESSALYRVNLSIVEAAMTGDPDAEADVIVREVEPLDEIVAELDLNGDGELTRDVTEIRGLPARYAGGARDVAVRRYQHPAGTEYLHTVRYVDPDAPDLRSRRVKELRYMRKVEQLDDTMLSILYGEEDDERDQGRLPLWRGEPEVGLRNTFGWQLQGFIEDARGRLRLQTHEEHVFCMGCHNSIGVTLDSTFSMARKVPGTDGWRVQDLRGMTDVQQSGHDEPEVLTYFRRVGGADELRGNDEMLVRFWPNGALDEEAVRRAAPGGDRDLAWLLTPSRERALDLARAYRAIVSAQSFVRGRDPTLRPVRRVHRTIEEAGTGLELAGRVHADGRLTLQW